MAKSPPVLGERESGISSPLYYQIVQGGKKTVDTHREGEKLQCKNVKLEKTSGSEGSPPDIFVFFWTSSANLNLYQKTLLIKKYIKKKVLFGY